MYKEMHIEYSDPHANLKPITLRYKLTDFDITQRWAKKLETSLNSYNIDNPGRFYGFDPHEVEKQKAINDINQCIDTINNYKKDFITKRVVDPIDQDTLNYLHHIFEVYHGTLENINSFYNEAPDDVKHALSELNLQVHYCEGFVNDTGRRQLPLHMATWYGLKKQETLELEDYNYFTDLYEFGTVYILYTEIGKTLQELAIDNDEYIHPDAYRPFRHYSSDFIVRFYTVSPQTLSKLRITYKKHYDQNIDFYLSRGFHYSHPYNKPGNIPVAKLLPTHLNVVEELRLRQKINKITLL
jgi:hypothetical protein